ncbi:Ig-like domain-containing protein [Bacillus sp. ISL-45]|uniref:Ig-like domain-containing protein n=1 Tax=Bacillus sp. ISL-45 TaxID=2819128 RepID=UPI001BEA0453|nr:Ig-like domain-containing protein [Bacillus sp. ISL-45]MBT2661685.1 S-layer homology domain-containing protein [Bacillus sp. ISL-45]
MSGSVTVYPGVKLKIEPGVEVIASSGIWFDVKGQLEAIGTSSERILLKDVTVKGWDFINSSIHLEYTDLSHDTFNGGYLVSSLKRAVTLRHNRFSNGQVSLSPQYSDIAVENNSFSNRARIDVQNGRSRVTIQGNTFLNEGDSIEDIFVLSRDPDGGTPNVFINRNNFFGFNKMKVRLDGYNRITFNGLDNYWGTTDPVFINQGIVDANDNINFRDQLDISSIASKPFHNGYPLGVFGAPKVNKVSDADSSVSGLTDGDSLVSVYSGSQKLGDGYSGPSGTFNIAIQRPSAGSQLRVTAVDSYGRVSQETVVTVEDKTAPAAPQVHEVTNESTKVTGTAETGSTVTVRKGSETVGSAIANQNGTFEATLIAKQPAGTILTVISQDAANNISPSVTVTVKNVTPPAKPVLSTMDITDQTVSISGTGQPGTTILVKSLSTTIGTAAVNQNGVFSVSIEKQKPGTMLEIIAKNGELYSEPVKVTVRDVTPPVIKFVSPILDQATSFYGMTEPGAKITVLKNGSVLASAVTQNDGIFLVELTESQAAGTTFEITATDAAGLISEVYKATVEKPVSVSFTDLSTSHRFYHEINYLVGRKVITGYADDTFRPGNAVTRAQAAIMIGRALELDGTKRQTTFKDVDPASVASGYIASAVERGIITGYADGTFRPDAPVTRGQMAIFLARAFSLSAEADASFTDVKEGTSSYPYIKRILAAGITTGYADGTYRPNGLLIRSDFSAFVARALEDRFKVK